MAVLVLFAVLIALLCIMDRSPDLDPSHCCRCGTGLMDDEFDDGFSQCIDCLSRSNDDRN